MNSADNKTVLNNNYSYAGAPKFSNDLVLTIFDENREPRAFRLNSAKNDILYFGRNGYGNDIDIFSSLVSQPHGRLYKKNGRWIIEDRACFGQKPSTNGILYNKTVIRSRVVADGDFFRIDNSRHTLANGVLMMFQTAESAKKWKSFPVDGKSRITIGRDPNNDIVLPQVSVSRQHAAITTPNGKDYFLTDSDSTNGTVLNNRTISGQVQLSDRDVISISDTKLIFTYGAVFWGGNASGIPVSADDLVITRGRGSKKTVTGDHISLDIKPGELVAIIGGSGAGKSTVLNALCGYLPPASGEVFINGVSLYDNFDTLKKYIGYVPQSDIVFDNLTLHDMLEYTAKLRLPADTSAAERERAIDKTVEIVELAEKKNAFIKSLSGGQRKRASIAVELLSDPNLLFLDEPASGLDPGTERNLMRSLRKMADEGKTVILVTHSTLQLSICDKIAFMGKGGRLCFFGSCDEALEFFRVTDIVDVYNLISSDPESWRYRYDGMKTKSQGKRVNEQQALPSSRKHGSFQFPILCSRYIKLVANDRQRLLLLILQAPLLALLISLVANGKQFEQYEMTKSLLFALSCSAFWVGMLNAIQEICKERSITKREYMTGLSLTSYVVSKTVVLGIMCVIQSVLLVGIFSISVGLPKDGLLIKPFPELLLTTLLTALSATSMGLFVSSLFTNPDRAMTVAPILLMPQILFSGLLFKLEGVTEAISWFTVCRWSMEGYGTTANLNTLPLKLQDEGFPLPHEAEDFFEFVKGHLYHSWGMLLVFTLGFLILARLALAISQKKSD